MNNSERANTDSNLNGGSGGDAGQVAALGPSLLEAYRREPVLPLLRVINSA